MYNHDILMSPIVPSDEPGREGYYFLVLRFNGSVGQPNGVHRGPVTMATETQKSYIKAGVLETSTMEEFNKMKDWYLKIVKQLKYTVLDTIAFTHKELLQHVKEGFPKGDD